ncbi:MAG: hypothetical protein ACXWI8_10235 [Burkholderiales bacterium]
MYPHFGFAVCRATGDPVAGAATILKRLFPPRAQVKLRSIALYSGLCSGLVPMVPFNAFQEIE